jgi:hypothetical protein
VADMNPLTDQQFLTHARLHREQLIADMPNRRNRRRNPSAGPADITSGDGNRPVRRPSRVSVIAFGALAFLTGGIATHGVDVDAQAPPAPPTTTQPVTRQPVNTPACDTPTVSVAPEPTTNRNTLRRPGARYDRLNWIAV